MFEINSLVKANENIVKELNILNWKNIYSKAKKNKNVNLFVDFIQKLFDSMSKKRFFLDKKNLKKVVSYSKKIENLRQLAAKIHNPEHIEKIHKITDSYKLIIDNIYLSYSNLFTAKMVKLLEKIKKEEVSDNNPNNLVVLKNVYKYYYNDQIAFEVLKNINLTIPKGKLVVILGPSGSGKTTLLNLISGMDKPSAGQVIVCNENLINKSITGLTLFRKKNVGYIFQQYGLLPNLTAKENVEIGLNLKDKNRPGMPINEIMEDIGIISIKDKMPAELSGGQQQRVSIARSIAKSPYILFGDEPTGAVDQKTSAIIMQLFVKLNTEYKTSVIIVTHNPAIAELADLIIHVNDGKIEMKKNPHKKEVSQVKF